MIDKGSKVSIEYKLVLDDGTEVDSNVGGEPLEYEHGTGQIIAGLESALAGLAAGDEKQVKVAAADGYGQIDPEGYHEVELSQVPEGAREPGALLMAEGHDGPIRVHEVKADKIILDFNHPLAGQDLTFDVKILKVD